MNGIVVLGKFYETHLKTAAGELSHFLTLRKKRSVFFTSQSAGTLKRYPNKNATVNGWVIHNVYPIC